MEEENIMQDIEEDNLETEMAEIEKEKAEEAQEESSKTEKVKDVEEVKETYEGYKQEATLNIVNTATGEVIAVCDPKRDEGIVQIGKAILNKLDKIAIASGA